MIFTAQVTFLKTNIHTAVTPKFLNRTCLRARATSVDVTGRGGLITRELTSPASTFDRKEMYAGTPFPFRNTLSLQVTTSTFFKIHVH